MISNQGDRAAGRRFRFVLFTMGLLLVLNVVGALGALGWKSFTFNTALILALLTAYAARYRDTAIAGWLLFGLSAGFIELGADWWLVAKAKTLVFPPDEPMIWASPAYMPFAWAMVLTQLGSVGAWLRDRVGLSRAMLLTGVLGGISIPLYEHLAKDANWWFFHNTPMLWDAPYFVIATELLISLPLPWLARRVEAGRPAVALALGIGEGIFIYPCMLLLYRILG